MDSASLQMGFAIRFLGRAITEKRDSFGGGVAIKRLPQAALRRVSSASPEVRTGIQAEYGPKI